MANDLFSSVLGAAQAFFLGKNAATVMFTNIAAALFAIGLLKLCHGLASDRNSRYGNYLLFCLGALVGWALSMFFVPYGSEDKSVFENIGKIVSVFVSGYALSKLDRLLEASLFDDKKPRMEAWVRTGLFAATALLALLTVVTNRLYFHPEDETALPFFADTGASRTARHLIDDVTESVYLDVLRSGAQIRIH